MNYSVISAMRWGQPELLRRNVELNTAPAMFVCLLVAVKRS